MFYELTTADKNYTAVEIAALNDIAQLDAIADYAFEKRLEIQNSPIATPEQKTAIAQTWRERYNAATARFEQLR
jgi:hypothetical protein